MIQWLVMIMSYGAMCKLAPLDGLIRELNKYIDQDFLPYYISWLAEDTFFSQVKSFLIQFNKLFYRTQISWFFMFNLLILKALIN